MSKRHNLQRIPAIEDAQLVARTIATDSTIRRIILYGSVASGEANTKSDIDLLVIVEDLNYKKRHFLSEELVKTAENVTGFPINILLSDEPEFSKRLRHLKTSFERKVCQASITLLERPFRSGKIRHDKPIGAPSSDLAEAVSRLADTCEPLLASASVKSWPDTGASAQRQQKRQSLALMRYAHMIIESSMKSLIHLQFGQWPSKARDHHLLIDEIPKGSIKKKVKLLLAKLDNFEKSWANKQERLDHLDWRWPGPRMGDVPDGWWLSQPRSQIWIQTACDITLVAITTILTNNLHQSEEVRDIKICLQIARQAHGCLGSDR